MTNRYSIPSSSNYHNHGDGVVGDDNGENAFLLSDNHTNNETYRQEDLPTPLSPSFVEIRLTQQPQTLDINDSDNDNDDDMDMDMDNEKDNNNIPTLLRKLLHRITQLISNTTLGRRLGIHRRCCSHSLSYHPIIHYYYNITTNTIRTQILYYSSRHRTPTLHRIFVILLSVLLLFSLLSHRLHHHLYNSHHHNPLAQRSANTAEYQSYGLFHGNNAWDNIPNDDWERQRERLKSTSPHRYADVNVWIDEPNVWYHNNWNADFTCPFEERVGGVWLGEGGGGGGGGDGQQHDGLGWLGDGPKWVCNPRSIVQMVQRRMALGNHNNHRWWWPFRTRNHAQQQSSPPANGCLIYSVGVNGENLEFEHSIQHLLTKEAARLDYDNYGAYDVTQGATTTTTTTTTTAGAAEDGTIHNTNIYDGAGVGGKTPFCEIHVFDPGGYHEKVFVGEGIHYHDWGIVHRSSTTDTTAAVNTNDNAAAATEGGADTANNNNARFKSFQETVEELGHVGHAVDIMKVDCKMCEWDIFQDWFDRGYQGDGGGDEGAGGGGGGKARGLHVIHQLLVEVHGTPPSHVNAFFDRMREENYVIFHKEPNTQVFGGTCQDFAFLKLRPAFFE